MENCMQFITFPYCVDVYANMASNEEHFHEYDKEHRVLALCLYAAILEDEGK